MVEEFIKTIRTVEEFKNSIVKEINENELASASDALIAEYPDDFFSNYRRCVNDKVKEIGLKLGELLNIEEDFVHKINMYETL